MAGYTLKLSIYTIALRDSDKNDATFQSLHNTNESKTGNRL
jgi:hypothetical protein